MSAVPWMSVFVRCAVLCIAYAAGSAWGHALVLPGSYVSILWPPNTILLVALLVAPPRHWFGLLTLILPVHLGIQYVLGASMASAALYYLYDCALVLLAAASLRRFNLQQVKLVGVRQTLLFIAAIAVSVAVASTVWSPLIAIFRRGEDLWSAWYLVALSNLLPFLIATPGIVALLVKDARLVRRASLKGTAELALLSAGLASSAFGILSLDLDAMSQLHGLVLSQLPFLLWAAVRFGPPGLSWAFMLFTTIATFSAVAGQGPFFTEARPGNALWLQVFVIGLYLPLLFLASLVKERRRREIQLRESEARYRALIAATTESVWRTDAAGNVTAFSQAWESLTGQDVDEAQHFGWLNVVHPEDRERVKQDWTEALRTKTPYEAEWRVQAVDGSVRHVHVHAVPVVSPDGRVREFVGATVDVSDRKWAEEAREKLAHASRLALAGELTASMAHEVNQPLTALLANVEAARLLLQAGPQHLPEVQEALADVRRDGLRLKEVIRSMRHLLRTHEIEMESLDLNDVVSDVARLVRADALRRRVSMTFDLMPEALPIRGDRIHLQQVLLNLLVNAMEAMEHARSGSRTLVTRTTRHNGVVEVAVSDSGPGVAPEVLSKVFTSFFTTKQDGMGLGLAITRSMVQAHGGHVDVENNTSGGATFRVVLPILRVHAESVRGDVDTVKKRTTG